MTALRRTRAQLVAGWGWTPGTDIEDVAARMMHRAGFTPTEVRQQHRVGPYRLDFAFLDVRVALEVDGPRHFFDPATARKDAERDAFLRAEDWLVCRVDAQQGEEGLEGQVARVCRLVHALRRNGDVV